MKFLVNLVILVSVTGCMLLAPRSTPSASDETLVSRLENAVFDKLIDDLVAELQATVPAEPEKLLDQYAVSLERNVDEARLTRANRNQADLLRAVATEDAQSSVTALQVLQAFETLLASLPDNITPRNWASLCPPPMSSSAPQEDLIQLKLNEISDFVFDIEPGVSRITSISPEADLEIRFYESAGPSYVHFRPGPETSVYLVDLARAPDCELAVLTYMNTLPGKLIVPQSRLSIALDQHAFMEGWALYVVSQIDEGFAFRSDEALAGRYRQELFALARALIAIQVVWSREESIEFIGSHLSMSAEEAGLFVDETLADRKRFVRAIDGYMTFKRLRAMAESRMGDDFSPQAFHNELLRSGALPIPLVERRIEAWLAMAK